MSPQRNKIFVLTIENTDSDLKVHALHWVIPEKIHTPPTDDKLEILTGGGLIAQEIRAGGGSEMKNSSSGVTINFNLDRNISTT